MKTNILKSICFAFCFSCMTLVSVAQGIVVNMKNGKNVYYNMSEVDGVSVYGYGEEPGPLPDESVIAVKGVYFKMVRVSGGTFRMGSVAGDSDEQPVHEVALKDYMIGETEVTQELWEAVMGTNPSCFKGNKKPVECVSWDDCQMFISKLNKLTGCNFRLPTEAEWEFAARGGVSGKGLNYSGSKVVGSVAWYSSNSNSTTHDVATKAANELGVYDMSGNVWEWCQDWYDTEYYSSSVVNSPTGPSSGAYRVFRGGSWCLAASLCRSSFRSFNLPSSRFNYLGFRLAL